MSRARDNANNWAADITAVSAGVGITGGGTSGAVTVTNEMATTIDAKGDLVVGTGADTYTRVPVGSNNQVLTADSATTSGVKWATADALPSQTGNSGKYLTTNGTTASWGTVSQPITWTARKGVTSGYDSLNSIASNGSNIYVAAGSAGQLFSSSDALTWTSRTSGFGSNNINHVSFGNGLFVAVGQNGTITTSTDGTTWTARTSNVSTNTLSYVAYLNNLWIAVGAGANGGTGGITTSSDGITWTQRTTPGSSGTTAYYVTYGNGYYVVGTNSGTSKNLLYSTNGTSWTATATSDTSARIDFIHWNGSAWIAASGTGNGNYQTSTSTPPTTGWSNIYNYIMFSTSTAMLQTAVYNNNMYFFNGSNTVQGIASLQVMSTVLENGAPKGFGSPILLPWIHTTTASFGWNFTYQGLLIRSDGSFIVSDSNGRIYTSF